MNDADKVDAFGYPTAPEQFSQALRPIVTATVETLQSFPEDAPAAAPEQLNQTLKPIAAASSETLEALPGATTAATEPAGDDDRPAIFIADVADTLRPLRRQLVTRIGDRARLLDNIPPPLERTAHDRAVVDALDQADLSIHLLDQWPGREIEDDESTSYPRHQADLAATSGSRSLIWVPESLTEEDFDDKEQLAWLEQMEQASRDSGGYQLVRSGREPFIAQVLETLDRIAAQRADADTGPAQFLIDTHRKDQRYAFSLAAGLAGRIPDLVVDFTRDAEGPDGWKQFDDAVHRARDLIVLFGQVAPDWVRRRVKRAYQVAFGSADSNLESIWVMLLPSCPGMPRLIPALEGGFLVQDRDLWRIATLKPGEAPVRHLAAALLELADQEPNLGPGGPERFSAAELGDRVFDEGADPAIGLLAASPSAGQTNLLILVDQFEELFRFGLGSNDPQAREQAETFASLLLQLAGQRELPVYVCITMRSDFLGDCDAFIGLPEAINAGQFLVPRLTRAQRRQAIEGPVRLGGGEIAPRLVDRLLNENLDTRDDLPILQHPLMRVWDQWAGSPSGAIDLKHYGDVHGILRALDRHAEEALKELDPDDRTLARSLFQTLTEIDPGNRRILRPAHLSEIAAIAEAPAERILGVIDCFRSEGRNFLVLSSENPTDDPLVDISHESLIRQWETLRGWVDQEAAAAKLYRRLAGTAALHAEGEAGLYREAGLEQAIAWQRRDRPNANWAKRYPGNFDQAMAFLRQSRLRRCEDKRERKRTRVERERLLKVQADLAQEKADLAERNAEQERAARKRARRLTAGMGVLAVLMLKISATRDLLSAPLAP